MHPHKHSINPARPPPPVTCSSLIARWRSLRPLPAGGGTESSCPACASARDAARLAAATPSMRPGISRSSPLSSRDTCQVCVKSDVAHSVMQQVWQHVRLLL